MIKVGFIDYYLDEWHANNYPNWLKEASKGEIEVAYAYGLIDSPHEGGRTSAQWCAEMGVALCCSMDELIEKSDVLVVLSPDNCEMHEALCQAPLRSGKRTYIDKTFAPDIDTAKRIFAVAEQYGTPCWSTSALRFASEYQGIKNAGFVASWGPVGFETYSIHQLEPIFMMMGCRAKRVLASCGEGVTTHLFEMEDGRSASVTCIKAGSPFVCNVVTKEGERVINVESNFFMAFIEAVAKFFMDGEVPVSHEETNAIMAAYGAGKEALLHPGQWIEVRS